MLNTKIGGADLAGKGVIGLPDTPGLSAPDIQAKFDEIALEVLVPKHNALVEALMGPDGAAGIGAGGGTVAGHLADTANPHAVTAAQVGAYTKSETDSQIAQMAGSGSGGSGDMVKAVYDTNNNGMVDNSEKLEGHPAVDFAPASHASATTAYGISSATEYGHTRVINTVASASTTDAAAASALKYTYDIAAAALPRPAMIDDGALLSFDLLGQPEIVQYTRRLLWSGSAAGGGTITIPRIMDYRLFIVVCYSANGNLICAGHREDSGILSFFGGFGDMASHKTCGGAAIISGTTLYLDVVTSIQHNASGSHNSAQNPPVTEIWGMA